MDWLDAQSVLETGKTVGASITSIQVSKSYAELMYLEVVYDVKMHK